MKKTTNWLKSWLLPEVDAQTVQEIHTLNNKNIHYVSLVVGIIQLASLTVYVIANAYHLDDSAVLGALTRVGLSVILCAFGFIVSGLLMKSADTVKNHLAAVKIFIGGFIILMILWGMFVSVDNYVNGQQLLTFYTVELLAVVLVKLRPLFTTFVILGSYAANFLMLSACFGEGQINPYNYMMLAVLSVVGAVLNYRLTVSYIAEKNMANALTDAMEIISNYDSLTRLQNRYALNQKIPEYIGTDICVAMGDVNQFKKINDTYGHRTGDDVLKAFSEILLEVFLKECVFRFGGDEFLVIEYGSDLVAFHEKLREVNRRFAAAQIAEIKQELCCSFGCVSAQPQDIAEFFDMITQADKNLYREKERLKAGR